MTRSPSFTSQWMIALLIVAGIGRADAQVTSQVRPTPASNPYQQTLSPYLDLLRSDASALSPYHSFVRPRQQIRQQFELQSSQIQRIQRETLTPANRTSPERLQTGRGGSFNNFLHYYNSNPSTPRR
ncbi:MAG: hypothetical protein WBD31_29395 [Rubripirellula sp.]